MAPSTTAKPLKRLGDFLQDQQEPFVLEVYLLERGYSKKSSSEGIKGTQRGYPKKYSKVLKDAYKKLVLFSDDKTKRLNNKREDVNVKEATLVGHKVVKSEGLSFASSSSAATISSNSCLDSDELETYTPLQKGHNSIPGKAQQVCHKRSPEILDSFVTDKAQRTALNRKHWWGFVSESKQRQRSYVSRKETPSHRGSTFHNLDQELKASLGQRPQSCSFFLPKKISEDSVLSASLWELLIQSSKGKDCSNTELQKLIAGSNLSQTVKSKKVLQQTKQLLFDCVREIGGTIPRKESGERQIFGAEELGKLICKKIKEWGDQAGDERNLSCLVTLDYLNSINEWSNFEAQKKEIAREIGDAILEEIVSEMIDFLGNMQV